MAATGNFTRNGHPVLTSSTSGQLPRLRKWIIPGTNRHLVIRDGSMGFLLVHFALWWHDVIGRLDVGIWDEWGYASRPPRGGSGWSEHAAGAAIDLNATQHPMGAAIARVFRAWQITRIRVRLAFYRGCLRWGGEWNRPDGMHVEVIGGLNACERRARQLMRTPRGRAILKANPGARAVILS